MEDLLRQWVLSPTIGRLVAAIIGVLVVVALVRFFQRSVSRYVKTSDNRYRARKLITFLGYLAAVMVVATVYSNRLGGFTVAFGVAGAGIAFALQEVIASVAGWAAISFAEFYDPGDRVQLGGIRGDVIDISILRTTLMEVGEWVNGDQYSGRVVRISNSFVFKEPVFNYSGDFPFLWDEIMVPVKYGCDYRLAREILKRVASEVVGDFVPTASAAWRVMVNKYLIEDAVIEPQVMLIANDNWMEFTVRYVVDYKKRRTTKDRLFTRVLEEFEQTNGKVAIASATFHLVEAPPFEVRVTNQD